MIKNEFDKKAIGAIRYIGLKSIQNAKGGHIGMAISAAPITYTLFTKFIKINPNDGKWINRDRFVLSGGHGSMCLYPIFYLSGIFNKQDMLGFKTKHSKTPGHPEYENKKSNFIDASTGPLGQGLAMAVGMAIAEKYSRNKTSNKCPGLIDNWTYVVCGDGDLQEGVSYEAMAIAGKYELNRLIVLHDSNKFQLDSAVDKVSSENLKMRAESNNWFYIKCSNDPNDIEDAIKKAQQSLKPSFIEVDTIIAEGLPVGNTDKGHHGNVSEDDLKEFLKYHNLNFQDWEIDKEIMDFFENNVSKRGLKSFKKWEKIVEEMKQNNSLDDFCLSLLGKQINYENIFQEVKINESNLATRVYLKSFLKALDNECPLAIAASADLTSSTNVKIGDKTILDNGQYLPVGIREFSMGAIMNGISLYNPAFKTIGGTFLVFADYIKPAIRLGALMNQPTMYVFTHDSYLVGGDGPTHQPYDQLAMLRAIENVNVYRPANEEELRYTLIESYNSKKETSIIVLSRQNIKSVGMDNISKNKFNKGAYIIKDCKNPDYVLAASGAEVELAWEVAKQLKNARVVSVPCLDKAVELSNNELIKMFSAKKAFITIEASSCYKWTRIHLNGQRNIHIGAYTFGLSMDGDELYAAKGFNVNSILKVIKSNK